MSVTESATTNADESKVEENLHALLKKLDLIGLPKSARDNAANGAAGVIESTTLEITTQVQNLIKALGGAAVVAGGATSAWAALEDNAPLAIAIVAGVAVLLAALVLGLARVVDGDVRGRSAATTQQIQSRADLASQYLKLAFKQSSSAADDDGDAPVKPKLDDELRIALAGYGNAVQVTTERGDANVTGLEWSDTKGLQIRLDDGQVVDLADVKSFTTKDADPPTDEADRGGPGSHLHP